MAKKVFDFTGGIVLLILTTPVLIILAVLVKIKMGSPVFFRQTRPGLGGRPFNLLKFRTMNNALEGQGELFSDDQRLTKLGQKLRKYSLDELPQLINVVRGDLSFVGPRPLLMQYLDRYTQEQARRHEVKPGITGWAQVNGRNAISWEEKFELDIWYVDNRSFLLDLKILWLTVVKVLRAEGISGEGSATMSEFMGSDQ
jgi:sugar transferase EpsL